MYINPKIVFKDYSLEKNKDKFFCNLCGFPHTTYEDFENSSKWDTCHECYLMFVEARRKEWKEGWRPDKETLKEYIYNKRNILISQEIK